MATGYATLDIPAAPGAASSSGAAPTGQPGGLWVTGVNTAFASTPDVAALDVVGDLDIRFRIAPASWATGAVQRVGGKWGAAGQRSYMISLREDGRIALSWSVLGTIEATKSSTIAVPFTAGNIGWIRATLDVDDGAAGRLVSFYTGTTDTDDPAAVVWTPLGTFAPDAGTTAIWPSTTAFHFGVEGPGSALPFRGKIHAGAVMAGIGGTLVLDARFTSTAAGWVPGETAGGTGVDFTTGKVITIAGVARIVAQWVVTGDIDVRWIGTLPDYSTAANQALVTEWTPSPNLSWFFGLDATGRLLFARSPEGTTTSSGTSTVTIYTAGLVDGQRVGFRVTRATLTGTTTFYWSTDAGVTWTQLGATVAIAANTALFATAGALMVGAAPNPLPASPAVGDHEYAEVRRGIGGRVVASIDFRVQTPGDLDFTDYVANPWIVGAPASIQLSGNQLSDLGVYIPPGALDTWEQAKREASVRPALAMVLGDSIPSGYNATNRRRLGHIGLLSEALHDRFGHGGEGFWGVNDAPHAGAYPPFGLTETGTWFHFGSLALNGASATVLDFSSITWPDARFRELYLWWSPTVGESDAIVSVDDVQRRVVETALQGQTPSAPWSQLVGIYADGDHEVTVMCAAPGAGLTFLGIEGRCGTGVRVHNMSHFGWVTSHASVPAWTGASTPANNLAEWTIRRFDDALDLFIYELGGNDAATGISPTVVDAQMRVALNKARAVNPDCSIAIIIAHPGDGVAINPAAYTAIAQAQHRVAADYGAAVIDLWARSHFTPIIWAPPGDAVHPDNAGHAWYAESTIAALAQDPTPIGC